MRQVSGALEVVPLEYARAQQGNAGSLDAARQAQAELDEATLLRQLNPGGVREAQAALADLARTLDTNGSPQVVEANATRA
ncbi:hypothetical protein [Deinococcus aerius]|uniref:hypothetical protein n=1 Tax=Deinococcus aerius TaxID=200253 RepID=UPI0013FDEEC6|nr:hypothetical protein [Deinococcus aerius]